MATRIRLKRKIYASLGENVKNDIKKINPSVAIASTGLALSAYNLANNIQSKKKQEEDRNEQLKVLNNISNTMHRVDRDIRDVNNDDNNKQRITLFNYGKRK